MNWNIVADLCLGAAALSVARDARKAAESAAEAARAVGQLLLVLTSRVDGHERRITIVELVVLKPKEPGEF